jgi:hypothetical protein
VAKHNAPGDRQLHLSSEIPARGFESILPATHGAAFGMASRRSSACDSSSFWSRHLHQDRGRGREQRWLGHHSPAFTLSVYVGLLDGDLGEPLDSDAQGVSRVSAEGTDTGRNADPPLSPDLAF